MQGGLWGPAGDSSGFQCEPRNPGNCDLSHGEAIEEPVATRGDQVWLGAAAGSVGSIPGMRGFRVGGNILRALHRRIALTIGVSKHGHTGAAAGPVGTGEVHVRGKGTTVLIRAGQDVMHIGPVTPHLDRLTRLVERIGFTHLVTVAVEIGDTGCDDGALGALPWTIADAVARIDCIRAAAGICAEIGVPSLVARAGSLRQRLAMGICAGEPAEIAAFARTNARDEEGHVRLLSIGA